MHITACVLLLTAYAVHGRIYQTSNEGEPAAMKYSVQVAGGESECSSLLATGNLTIINTTLYFDGGTKSTATFAADMFLVVKELTEEGEMIQCLQYGGWNYNYPECGVVDKWPTSWNSHLEGWYNYTAVVSRAQFNATQWSVCVGNGYTTASGGFLVDYTGSLKFSPSLMTTGTPPTATPSELPTAAPTISPAPSILPTIKATPAPSSSFPPSAAPSFDPTSAPSLSHAPTATPWALTSECDEPVELSYDLSLAGKEMKCLSFAANASLDMIDISLYFSGSETGEWAYDMALLVYYSTQSSGVQVGGFNYYIPGVQYAGEWPSSWRSVDEGLYTALENVTQYGIEGEGYYGICMANAWSYASEVNYKGTVQLLGLNTRCDIPPPTPAPTDFPTAPSLHPTDAPSVPTAAPSVPTDTKGGGSDDDDDDEAVVIGVTVPFVILACIAIAVFGAYYYKKKSVSSSLTTPINEPAGHGANEGNESGASTRNPMAEMENSSL